MRDLISTITNKTPVPLVGRGVAMSSQYGGTLAGFDVRTLLRLTKVNSTLYGTINTLTTSTAAVDWKLWRKAASGKKEDRTEVTTHPSVVLWTEPNPFFDEALYVESIQQHVELAGKGWVLVSRVGNVPTELWFCSPERVRPVKDQQKYIAGYIYTSPDGERVPLDVKDVFELRIPDPADMYEGLSPVVSLIKTIDAQRLGEEYNRNLFANNARPGGVIEAEEGMGDIEFNLFQKRWAETHQGVGNVQRVAILENGMKWVDTKFSMRDLQYAELADVTPDKIREAYGFPKFMSGRVDDVNRATAEASSAAFGRWLLTQRLDRWKNLRNKTLKLYGTNVTDLEWDYEDPVPADAEAVDRERTSLSGAFTAYVGAGLDGKETALFLGLPPKLAESWEKPEPKPAPGMPGAPGEPGAGKTAPAKPPAKKPKPKDAWAELTARLLNEAPDDEPDLQQVQDEWETALAAVIAAWGPISAAQRAELVAQITTLAAAGDVAGFASLTVSTGPGAEVLATALAALAVTAAATMAAEAAVQGIIIPAAVFAAGAFDAVAAATAGLLGAGLAAVAGREATRRWAPGADPADIAVAVGTELAGLSDSSLRAELGGALTRAQNEARLMTVEPAALAAADVPQAIYSASEVLDKNTCLPCAYINGYDFPAWIDAWSAYAGGPYRNCDGRSRCRGTVVARWNPEADL